MVAFLTAGENVAFAVALALLLAFFVIELLGLLFGASVSGLLGELDLPDMDLDADIDLGVATKFLYWLKIGRVPLLILIVIFITAFAVCGYVIQFFCLSIGGVLLPIWLAAPMALLLAAPVMRLCGRFFARLIPRDETAAISQSELVGGRAVITIGTAKKGFPAEARTRDRFGTTHYVMVEPDNPGETLEMGRDLLLVRCSGALFFAIAHPEPDPSDE